MATPKSDPITDLNELCKKKEELTKTAEQLSRFNLILEKALVNTQEDIQKNTDTQDIKKRAEAIALENELLELENSRLQKHYELATQRNSLELQFIEQHCEHKAKIEKIKEKYSFVDVKDIVLPNSMKTTSIPTYTAATTNSNTNTVHSQSDSIPTAPSMIPSIVLSEQTTPVVDTTSDVKVSNNKATLNTGDQLQQHLQTALKQRFKNT